MIVTMDSANIHLLIPIQYKEERKRRKKGKKPSSCDENS